MRQGIGSALVQIMVCRLLGTKPLAKPSLGYWTRRNTHQWNFNQNTNIFIYENAPENIVCEMAAILSRGRWVNTYGLDLPTLSILKIETTQTNEGTAWRNKEPCIKRFSIHLLCIYSVTRTGRVKHSKPLKTGSFLLTKVMARSSV